MRESAAVRIEDSGIAGKPSEVSRSSMCCLSKCGRQELNLGWREHEDMKGEICYKHRVRPKQRQRYLVK